MRTRSAIVALGIALMLPASAQGQTCLQRGFAFCSKTFHATAPCDGQDHLARIAGNHCPGGGCNYCPSGTDCPLIQSWEPSPILIVGIEVTFFQGATGLQYAYAGNDYHPNQMMFAGNGQTNRSQFFPRGLGFRMPSAGVRGHINLHIACRATPDAQAQAWFTIYYESRVDTVPRP